ncbi:MAG: phage portal protein [Rhizobiales bacterium]|nr:phage portal protein [Hyphomicrobiales bacterium]
MWNPFRRKPAVEIRQGQGFTAEIMSARAAFFSGSRGVAEATATVELCVSLWERAFQAADPPDRWRSLLSPAKLGMIGRALATRGQFVALIDNSGPDLRLVPATDWDVSTRQGEPICYRLSISETGGRYQATALAGEVVDIKINAEVTTPWHGRSPLRKARLTADTLAAIEAGLGEVMAGSWGVQIIPASEMKQDQLDRLEEKIQSKRGRVALVESMRSRAAGMTPPQGDWTPQQVTPDLRGLELGAHWEAIRSTILASFGIPPILFSAMAQSAALREGQRHAVLWSLNPISNVAAAELALKLDDPELKLDLITPLAAADSAGRARAVGVLVGNGMPLADALKLVGWGDQT